MYLFLVLTALGVLIAAILGTSAKIVLSSTVDVTSGEDVCANVTVEFICIATGVAFLDWFRNGVEIEDFNLADQKQMIVVPPYTLFLDRVSVFPQMVSEANFTSRLVVNLSDLMNGDSISCSQVNVGASVVLSYTLRGPPPAPRDFTISFGQTSTHASTMMILTFNIIWDSTFNSHHSITSYKLVLPAAQETLNGMTIECPFFCSPNAPCRCTGLPAGKRVEVNISAINCDDQEGRVRIVTVASSCEATDLGEVDNETSIRCGTSSSVSITNGVGCYSSLIVGSLVTYRCDEGYLLSGDFQRTCQTNGSWEGKTPLCTVSLACAPVWTQAALGTLFGLSLTINIMFVVVVLVFKSLIKHRTKSTNYHPSRFSDKRKVDVETKPNKLYTLTGDTVVTKPNKVYGVSSQSQPVTDDYIYVDT